jgi:nucleoside-diphosphate-sugar epimerase
LRVLVTGAFGQIGSELVPTLRDLHGRENVLATGRRVPVGAEESGPVATLDVLIRSELEETVLNQGTEIIYHLAAVLSAAAEQDPERAWQVNMQGLHNVLEVCRCHDVTQLFWPSSIAVFGPSAPRDDVPQETVLRPTTIYGVSKVAGELLADYYSHQFGLDVRGVRYPGIISSGAPPGGGTTDYAVEIFYAALRDGQYTSFVREDCVLPMLYMPDCIDAALKLMAADRTRLRHQTGYNLAGMSFSLGELVAEIRKHIPAFRCAYEPDERQAIADSWPRTVNDSLAREDWGWQPRHNLQTMTADMLAVLAGRLGLGDSE